MSLFDAKCKKSLWCSFVGCFTYSLQFFLSSVWAILLSHTNTQKHKHTHLHSSRQTKWATKKIAKLILCYCRIPQTKVQWIWMFPFMLGHLLLQWSRPVQFIPDPEQNEAWYWDIQIESRPLILTQISTIYTFLHLQILNETMRCIQNYMEIIGRFLHIVVIEEKLYFQD